jgi:hypothetical protein
VDCTQKEIPLVPPFEKKRGHLLPGISSENTLKNTKQGLCTPCPPSKRGTTGGLNLTINYCMWILSKKIPLVPPFEKKGGHLLTVKSYENTLKNTK